VVPFSLYRCNQPRELPLIHSISFLHTKRCKTKFQPEPPSFRTGSFNYFCFIVIT
jgi:hypothetical protein